MYMIRSILIVSIFLSGIANADSVFPNKNQPKNGSQSQSPRTFCVDEVYANAELVWDGRQRGMSFRQAMKIGDSLGEGPWGDFYRKMISNAHDFPIVNESTFHLEYGREQFAKTWYDACVTIMSGDVDIKTFLKFLP